ncbi:MAG: glycerate kinase [Acidobacteria bacterium]|nr:glycerate kinase [Acidobacteriota bacterium]
MRRPRSDTISGVRTILGRVFRRSLARVEIDAILRARVRARDSVLTVDDDVIDLRSVRRIVVVAIGKAAVPMTASLAGALAPREFEGLVVGPDLPAAPLPGCAYHVGGHPLPDARSLAAARAVLDRLRRVGADDLVIHLLSGGGSALFEQPIDGLGIGDLEAMNDVLVTGGPTIAEINVVRKHFSSVKGGRLAALNGHARQITLYVSDVPDDNPSLVASGPTMPDASTVADCLAIIDRSGLRERLPAAIRRLIDEGRIPETPKPSSPEFETSRWYRLVGETEAVEAMANEARSLEWTVVVDGGARDDWALIPTVDHLLGKLDETREAHPRGPVAVVSGGEFSCPVTDPGLGGRNQAFVLACVPKIAGRSVAVLSAGTDGVDGSAPAAGAVADGTTLARASGAGLDPVEYLRRADAHRFFDPLGDTVVTGPTGQNVRDLRLLVAW